VGKGFRGLGDFALAISGSLTDIHSSFSLSACQAFILCKSLTQDPDISELATRALMARTFETVPLKLFLFPPTDYLAQKLPSRFVL
jgi:hypothetical protein